MTLYEFSTSSAADLQSLQYPLLVHFGRCCHVTYRIWTLNFGDQIPGAERHLLDLFISRAVYDANYSGTS